MAKIPKLGSFHTIRFNDEAYFHLQKKIIAYRERGSVLTPIEIASNLILVSKISEVVQNG